MSDIPRSERKLTTEFLAYMVVILVAGMLRFLLLGKIPLDDHEANLALQALQWSRGEQALLSGEPGYIALTTFWFFLFNATEFTARFWPALAGTMLPLVSLFLREPFGKAAALLLAGLIAVDPVLIGISRSAESSALAILGLLAAIGFCLKRKPLFSGLSFGLALAGGMAIWPGVVVLAILVMLNRKRTGDISKGSLALTTFSAFITLLVLSTLFLTYPRGISAFGSSIVEYVQTWTRTSGAPLPAVSAAWLLSLFPLFVLAMWGLIEGIMRGDPRVKWLGIWAGASLVLALVNPARQLLDLFWVSIPLLSLAAIKLAGFFENFEIDNQIVFLAETGLVVALFVFSFMNAVNLVNNPLLNQEEYRNRVIGVILPLILLLGMTVLLAWGWSAVSTRKGLIAGAGILIAFFMISSSWKAASLGSDSEMEVRRDGGIPVGAPELLSTITNIARMKTGVENRIDLQMIDMELPSLEWALRGIDQAVVVSAFDPTSVPSIAVTAFDQEITAGASYRGQKILWQVNPDLKQMKFSDWMKWSIFRTAPVQETYIILWARNDLFPGGTIP